MERRSIPLTLGLLLFGCVNGDTFRVTVVFPDESAFERTYELRVLAIRPGQGSGCIALQEGDAAPGDPGFIPEDEATFASPLMGNLRPLKVVGSGERLFFAEAKDSGGAIILRGCKEAPAGNGNGAREVTIELGWVTPPCGSDLECQTNRPWCEGQSRCREGRCLFEKRSCFDNDVCTEDRCNEETRSCEHPPVTGPPENEGPPNDPTCNDGRDNDCDGLTDAADPQCKLCVNDANCDDDNPCTDDRCDSIHGCSNAARSGPCDDKNACSKDDHCSGGRCVGNTSCKDDNPCTDDTCNPASGCVFTNDDTNTCADGIACTVDSCDAGVCKNAPDDALCNDGEPCTDDTCEPVAGCVFTNDDTNACDDANDCTTDDRCAAGPCAGVAVSNNTPCAGGTCCSASCRAGWVCCLDNDCDDSNSCTIDSCTTGSCSNTCASPTCMLLDVASPANVGTPTALRLEACNAGLEVSRFVCGTEREMFAVVHEDFETGLGAFEKTGIVTRDLEAQNPNSVDAANQYGVKICGDDSRLKARISTSGMSTVGFRFSVANSTLVDNGQMLGVYFTPDDGPIQNLLLLGDGLAQPYQDYFFLLPTADERFSSVEVGFWLAGDGADGGNCVFVDDVALLHVPSWNVVRDLVRSDFSTGFAPFSIVDPQGNDVYRQVRYDGWGAFVDDHAGANLVSGFLDTTAVDPNNLLVVSWEWMGVNRLEHGDYVFMEYSVNGGASWAQLSGTGHGSAPSTSTRYQAVLPCHATGIPNLIIRFIAPPSAGNDDDEGAAIFDLIVSERRPSRIDAFGAFTDMTNGVYSGTMISSLPGRTNVVCRHGCGNSALLSNPEPVTITMP